MAELETELTVLKRDIRQIRGAVDRSELFDSTDEILFEDDRMFDDETIDEKLDRFLKQCR